MDILETDDGFLFLKGGRHSVFKLFSSENIYNKKNYFKRHSLAYLNNLRRRKRICDKFDLRYLNIVFPEKCLLFSKNSQLADYNLQSLYLNGYLTNSPNIGLHTYYPLELLSRDDYWMKTDTHLSPKGRLSISELITTSEKLFDQRQILANKLKFNNLPPSTKEKKYVGDLGKQLIPEREEVITTSSIHGNSSGYIKANNGLSSGNEGIIEITKNVKALTSYKLLIFGDSFMRQQLSSLALVYETIIFMRTRYFHREVLSDIHPDHLITSCAERYLSIISPDTEAPNFYTYPYLKHKAVSPCKTFSKLWSEVTSK